MFVNSRKPLKVFDVEKFKQLLAPFQELDESLIIGDDDGQACALKYNNRGNGVPRPVRMQIDALATAILNGDYEVSAEDRLTLIDLFTLYSNHLDQDRSKKDKPTLKEKEALVLNYLKAAFKLSPKYDYANLSQYSVRELSSHEQMLHFYAKAVRYEGVATKERLDLLMDSLNIAKYLSTKACGKKEDPHAHRDRIATREIVISYCLEDLHRYKEAIALILPHLQSESVFARCQAHTRLSVLFTKDYQDTKWKEAWDSAFAHAQAAVTEAKQSGSTLLPYNARVALMNVFQAVGFDEEANQIAHEIIAEMAADAGCGAKPAHCEAAQKVLDANCPAPSLTA